MSYTDFGQRDLAALRAVTKGVEFTQAEASVTGACGYPSAVGDSLVRVFRYSVMPVRSGRRQGTEVGR